MLVTIAIYFVLFLGLLYAFNQWYRGTFLKDFRDKSVFITGTDSGFGRQLALELDSQGLRVYAGCYQDQGIENLKKCASGRMRICKLDVTDRESIQKAKEFVEKDLPAGQGLWALVNNAGINKGTFFDFALIQDYRDVMAVNFFGAVEVIEVFMPLIKQAHGRIVNLISIMGRNTVTAGPYSSSKFAFMAYSDGLRRAMANFNVKVSIVEPGFFQTAITSWSFTNLDMERQWKNLPPELREEYGEKFFNKLKTRVMEFLKYPTFASGNKTEMVIETLTHAIGAKHPKDRYIVGFDAKYLYRPLTFLPDYVLDSLMHYESHNIFDSIAKKP